MGEERQVKKHHLTFKNLHPKLIVVTKEFFDAQPWRIEDPDEKYALYDAWLATVSEDVYKIEKPGLVVIPGHPLLEMACALYDRHQKVIAMRRYSVLSLFHEYRMHMQEMGCIGNISEYTPDQRRDDAAGWSCSLFYTLKPLLFRKSVREGKIALVHPAALLANPAEWAPSTNLEIQETINSDDDLTQQFNEILGNEGLL